MPQGEPGILLGDNFLRNTYIVYDLEDMEISIAQANFNGEQKILKPLSRMFQVL